MACFILPIALTIIFFSQEIVRIWTKNAALTEAVYPLVRVFIIGTACNALVTIPYMAQLAHGWAKLGLYQNIIAILFLIPSIIYLTNHYGVSGAVWAWLILNVFYILFSMPVMYRKILRSEKWKWYWNDMFLILISLLIMAVLLRVLFNYFQPQNTWLVLIYCAFVLLTLFALAILSAKYVRENISVVYGKLLPIKVIKQ